MNNTVSLNDRPSVTVRPQTANTSEIIIHTANGDVRMVVGHERIVITSISTIDIEVQP